MFVTDNEIISEVNLKSFNQQRGESESKLKFHKFFKSKISISI